MNAFTRDGHLTNAALLLMSESALPAQMAHRAEQHLQACTKCQSRRAVLHECDEEIATLWADEVSSSGTDAARAQLQERLQQATLTGAHPWRKSSLHALLQRRMLLRVATAVCLLVLAVAFRQAYRPLQDRMAAYEETGPEPDHALTPGSALPVSLTELCSRTDDNLDPPLPPEKARAVFRAYGMDDRSARAYQVDYLINPQLGGTDQMENLWPEPYHATVWNATAKDALETRLHRMVCERKLSLEDAQRDLASDWIAAYKKYFHTARPVRTIAAVNELER